ncbi:MAG: hypothetical protein WBC44_15700 [Planctomycetaceae bacterium]
MAVATRTAWLAITLALSGCLNPATTRMPTCAPASVASERRSLGHYDPLPDRNLGPDTDSRPREFIEARDPQRQSQEGQLFQGAPAGPVPSGYSAGAYRDGDVVR